MVRVRGQEDGSRSMAGFPSTFGPRALVCPLMKAWSLLLLLAAPIEAHVRLNYIDGSDQPIRNANSATGNGRASVAGRPPRFKRTRVLLPK